MSRVSAMASDARPYLATEGAANSGCLFASRATTQMSAIAPKPEGTGLSCQLRGRSAVAPLARGACHGRRVASRISSRKASVAAMRGPLRGSPVMDLILWRHADAEPGEPDIGRRLTAKGLKQAERVAAWLDGHLPDTTRILSSPAERAQQTARALKRKFRVVPELGPGAAASEVLAAAG